MFKVLILQASHSREYLIKDRLSFMRFLGLTLADRVPDANCNTEAEKKAIKEGCIPDDQLGREEGFAVVAQHDAEGIEPSTEVIRKFLPKGKPALILMDELLNYLNRERNRKTGLGGQLYAFVQNLSEEARAQDRVVLAVSLPSIVDEMTPEDEADFQRFEKLLDRLGKAMIMSAESETPNTPTGSRPIGPRSRTGSP